MTAKRVLIAINFLLIAILACNLQGSQATSTPDLAGTITAQALTLQAPPPIPSTGSPSALTVSVTSVTNCRTGPGTDYDLVFTMNPGLSAQLVGKDTADNYWIITNPAGGICWLWGQYAVTSGDTSVLPEYPPPPHPTAKFTKTPKPTKTPTETPVPAGKTFVPPIFTLVLLSPAGPTNLNQSRTCDGFIDIFTPKWSENVTVTWQDNATNETGYHIYKNNSLISSIPANSTSFQIELRYNQGTGGPLYDNFGVEAYNAFGVSSRPSLDVPRCP